MLRKKILVTHWEEFQPMWMDPTYRGVKLWAAGFDPHLLLLVTLPQFETWKKTGVLNLKPTRWQRFKKWCDKRFLPFYIVQGDK